MLEQLTVLVVDDDAEIVTAATLRLRAAGYLTRSAHDGIAAVALAAECQPNVVLLDVRMPRMDGLTALKELKQRDDTKHIPVVMLSASIVDQQAALDDGARYFLKKPYLADTLLRALASALETSPAQADP